MSEENSSKEDIKQEATPTDAFGEPNVEPDTVPIKEEKESKDDKSTPTEQVASLSREVGELTAKLDTANELHTTKDENIRAMADKIKGLEGKDANKGGEEQDGDVPFKEIKTSKDLTEDEKDEMTDAEISALDDSAVLKNTINKMATDLAKSISEKEESGVGKLDLNTTVREKAVELAGDDKELANQIIEAWKAGNFNTDEATKETVATQVAMAAGAVPNYQKPAEGSMGGEAGKGSPAGSGKGDDPYGVNAIVDQAAKEVKNEGFDL